jgi:hypothetical protein
VATRPKVELPTGKVTIAELEKILSAPDDKYKINIKPDGSLDAYVLSECADCGCVWDEARRATLPPSPRPEREELGALKERLDQAGKKYNAAIKDYTEGNEDAGWTAASDLSDECDAVAREALSLASRLLDSPAQGAAPEPVAGEAQAGDWILRGKHINELQQDSIARSAKRCKQAHYVDLDIRINGKNEREQADWVKWLEPVAAAAQGAVALPAAAQAGTPEVNYYCRKCWAENNAGGQIVICNDCGAETTVVFPLMEPAIPRLTKIWNRRAVVLPAPAEGGAVAEPAAEARDAARYRWLQRQAAYVGWSADPYLANPHRIDAAIKNENVPASDSALALAAKDKAGD